MQEENEIRRLTRCRWCNLRNPLYVAYHDKEWGVPVHENGCFLCLDK